MTKPAVDWNKELEDWCWCDVCEGAVRAADCRSPWFMQKWLEKLERRKAREAKRWKEAA